MNIEHKPTKPTNSTIAAALKLDQLGYDCYRVNLVHWRVTFPNGNGTILNNGELKRLAQEAK